MFLRSYLSLSLLLLTAAPVVIASADASKSPQFQTLPPLREQAKIVDAWTETRKALIPGILRKYNVDAWLVCLLLLMHRPYLGSRPSCSKAHRIVITMTTSRLTAPHR